MHRASDRVLWGVGLVALGVAGLVSSLHTGRGTVESSACNPVSVLWQPAVTPGGLPGVEFQRVEPGCRDATALVSYWRGDAVVYTSQMRLLPGARATVDASVEAAGPVDHVSWTLLGQG